MNLIAKTRQLNIRLDDNARNNSNASVVSLATYRQLVNTSTRHAKAINRYIQFPIEFGEDQAIFDETDLKRLKRSINEIEKGRNALDAADFESAKTRQQNARKSLESLEESAGSIFRNSLSTAKLAARKKMKSKPEFDFICRFLSEKLKQEFSDLHRVLNRTVVDDSSIIELGGAEFKRIIQRYSEIVRDNQVEIPDEVSVFLDRARDKYSGTTLKDLSPEVLKYLLEHGLASDFVVSPTKY
ncbi:hypothetical protein GCM10011352_04660 [Marinobacterium zhoushanense]|uniref:Uncharacterized protein n=1 Tax=Marinobacterium zhoushanense TaxID=1679163 RepID=A0ABQ1K3D3_9GAMM|nr:hypothetical protein [Marinobacterium zhoushanense]GGB81941.1 hypothetical protein GCM10011352_04660 [Marinobacterium zhoushanense]